MSNPSESTPGDPEVSRDAWLSDGLRDVAAVLLGLASMGAFIGITMTVIGGTEGWTAVDVARWWGGYVGARWIAQRIAATDEVKNQVR